MHIRIALNGGCTRLRALLAAVVLPLAAAACAQRGGIEQSPESLGCVEYLEAFDEAVVEADVGWSRVARVEGFPQYRVDRFLASYRQAALSESAFETWAARMRAMDRRGRGYELARLPAESLRELGSTPEAVAQRMEGCAEELHMADLGSPARLRVLRLSAVMPDDYSIAQRTFGLYPITFMPVSEGVYRLQAEIRADFATPPEDLPQSGRLLRYRPAAEMPPQPLPVPEQYDLLGIPVLSDAQLEILFAAHAPVWEIDTVGPFDLPGVPYWREPGLPAVRTDSAVSYRYHSWTRFGEEVLLQLSYLVWFDERPPRSANDLLSGRLDGVLWRVTLGSDGRPLVYDSVHPCGCYHMFLPSSGLTPREPLHRAPEPPLVPAAAPAWDDGSRIVLRLASGSHYLQSVYRTATTTGATYEFRDYSELYRIAGPDGLPVGLFAADGLVDGTERAERWVLWPMGVISPGAMRGRGRQATAFIGRRHFDDPRLIETVFQPADGSSI